MGWGGFNRPAPPAFIGGPQPLEPKQLTPPTFQTNNPPFGWFPMMVMLQARIAETWKPYQHPSQPMYQNNVVQPFIPDNPPFGSMTKNTTILSIIAASWSWFFPPPQALRRPSRQIISNVPTQSSNTQIRKWWFRSQ